MYLKSSFSEARAEIKKWFCLFFGSNEYKNICFWNLLTFNASSFCRSKIIFEGDKIGLGSFQFQNREGRGVRIPQILSKVVKKNQQKMCSKLINLSWKKIRKTWMILDIKKLLWKSDFGNFGQSVSTWIHKEYPWFPLRIVIFGQKVSRRVNIHYYLQLPSDYSPHLYFGLWIVDCSLILDKHLQCSTWA